jgi:hypothetical protein
MKTNPSRHMSKVAAAAAAEEEQEEEEGDMEGGQAAAAEADDAPALVGAKLSAPEIYKLPSEQVMNAGQFKAAARDMLEMKVDELKKHVAELAERYDDFTFAYRSRSSEGNKATAQLAVYEQYSKMFGFKPLDSTLPAALLKERKRQRGDVNEEAAAEEPKPKMTVFDRLERAAQLAPQGEKFLVRPSTAAGAPPPAAAGLASLGEPWRGAAAQRHGGRRAP